jgi:N-succinyl-L-ornithine transcarbamylase
MNFITQNDIINIQTLVQEALELKTNPLKFQHLGKGKTLGLLFFNSSLRTRISTRKAAQNLGLESIVLNTNDGWQLEFEDGSVMNADKAEHVKEAAAVMSQYFDILGIRAFPGLENRVEDYSEKLINAFLKNASVPILNLESSTQHPLQSVADLVTIEEYKTVKKPKIVLSWAPHPKALPQSVANSFAIWTQAAGYDLTITHPEGMELSPDFVGNATVEYDQKKAFEGADFIYTKNWSSFKNYGQPLQNHEDWMVTQEKMALTNKGYFMHCLPVRRNVVVEDAVLDGSQSLVIQQANNRTFAAQAVLKRMLEVLNK